LAAANWFLALILALAGLASAVPARGASAVPYQAAISGLDDPDHKALLDLLQTVSDVFALQDRPPASLNLLRARAESDLAPMRRALNMEGYFQASVALAVDGQARPVRVVFQVSPGPAFILGDISIQTLSRTDGREPDLPAPANLGLQKGARFRAEVVIEAQKRLLAYLGRRGRPFPKIQDRRVLADHATGMVSIAWTVDPGPEARFGATLITGDSQVHPRYAARLLPWTEGRLFDSELLNQARSKLIETGRFSSADIQLGQVDPEGRLPVTVTLKDRAFRTIRTGLAYQTDVGLEASVEWEHRNIFGAGQKLSLSAKTNEVQQSMGAALRLPGFWDDRQTLIIGSTYADEYTNAYRSRGLDNSVTLERVLATDSTGGLGLRYRMTRIDDQEETFGLLSLPVYYNLDRSDDLLDPTRGFRFNVLLAPFTDIDQNTSGFFKFRASHRHYFSLGRRKRTVLALRASVGFIEGVDRDQAPADERFYAGGGGSIRGYAYQSAGDVSGTEPLGGLSILDVSGELRYRIGDNFGLAAFIDGGRAFTESRLDLDQHLFWGAGLGLRYYTPIGPLRLDLGFPLDKRTGVDDDYQLYVSLGQAF